jgi:hypothetical protein
MCVCCTGKFVIYKYSTLTQLRIIYYNFCAVFCFIVSIYSYFFCRFANRSSLCIWDWDTRTLKAYERTEQTLRIDTIVEQPVLHQTGVMIKS